MTVIGVALLIGDGVITPPAISILSAVEGLVLIPGFGAATEGMLILIAAAIAIGLFAVQQRGTERVAWSFGPLAGTWFLALAVSGIIGILWAPAVLLAVNPYYAIQFLLDGGWPAFFLLSSVILVATGGEALYADMGHLGELLSSAPGISSSSPGAQLSWSGSLPSHPPPRRTLRPLRDGQEHLTPPDLCPVPPSLHPGHHHRLPGDDQRTLLDRLPGGSLPVCSRC